MSRHQVGVASTSFLKRKKNHVWALAGVGLLHGALCSYGLSHPPTQMGIQMFCAFTFNLALLGWCYADSEERRIPITRFLGLSLFLFAAVGVPWYFLRSRGIIGAMKGAFGLGLIALWYAAMLISFTAYEAATGQLGSY